MVVMGRVAGSWGVQGWLKVTPYSGEPTALLDHAMWWLRRDDGVQWEQQEVTASRQHGALLVAQFAGLTVPETAQAWRGATVAIPRAQLPPPDAGEMYMADLEGMTVVNRGDVVLGKVEAVQEFGAHPVLRVVAADGQVRLLPFVPKHVDQVDVAGQRVVVDWGEDF